MGKKQQKRTLRKKRRIQQFASLYITNFWGVMNDNVLKILVCFIAATWVGEESRSLVVSITAGALVLPYLIFSPIAGKLPMYWSKLKVFRICKLAEIPIMLIATLGFAIQSLPIAIGAVLLMGLQSALYSPSKYGLIKDIGGIDGVSEGMGGMEAIAFLGILLGTIIASFLAEMAETMVYCGFLLTIAIFGVISSYTLHVYEGENKCETSVNPIKFIRDSGKLLKKYEGLTCIVHTLSLFWWLAALIQIVVVVYCPDTLGLSPSQTGYILTFTAIGITLGCLMGGRIGRSTFLLGYTPIIGMFVAILLLLIFLIHMPPIVFGAVIFVIAFAGGIFKIPLDAEIQKRVDASELNVVLAYFNLISFVYIFLASATNILITMFLPTRYTFLCMAVVFFVAMFIYMFNYKSVISFIVGRFLRTHYNIIPINREILHQDDGRNMLILPNHRAVIDPMLIFSELYDVKAQPLVDEGYFRIPLISHLLRMYEAIEVPDLTLSRKGVDKVKMLGDIVHTSLENHANVLFYPSGHITTDGRETIGSRHLTHTTCQNLPEDVKVIAIRMKGLWGSKWSRYGLNATPSIIMLLLKSFGMIFSCVIFFKTKRTVTMEYEDITDKIIKWKDLPKLDFNRELENYYNEGNEGEKPILM